MKAKWNCVYCGGDATTRDHVPPKSIFFGTRKNLVTVPSCEQCNNSRSELDQSFRDFLSLATRSEASNPDLWQKTLRGLARQPSKLQNLLRSAVELSDGDFAVELEAKAQIQMFESIARGLYFHHFGEVLDENISIDCGIHDPSKDISQLITLRDHLIFQEISDGEFQYCYGRANDREHASIWLFLFYGKFFTYSFTNT